MRFMIFCAIAVSSVTALASGTETQFQKHFNHQNGVAIHGYDVVSYFNGVATQGSPSFEVVYENVRFQFSSEDNATEFDLNPEKYIPAYGGWCATAIGMMNTKLDVTPDSFLIQDGILFLFSTSMGPAKDQWIQGQPGLRQTADANWSVIYSN